jgi:drug/metabolite transporter (DMT)-like permease
MPPALQGAIVMGMLTLASGPMIRRDRVPVRATRAQWGLIGCLVVADSMNIGLFFAAYQRTTVAIAVLTHYLTPIFVALAAPLVLGERARLRTFVAVAIAFAGLVLLLQPWHERFGHDDLVGALLGGGSAVFYATNVIISKRLAPAFSGAEMSFFHGIIATPLLFATVSAEDWRATSTSALVIVLLGAIGPGAASGLFFLWGLRRIVASHASVLTLLEPFVAVILAAAVLHEPLGAAPIVGAIAILGGAALVVTGRV